MGSLLGHLWPTFEALFDFEETRALSAWFWIVMVGVFALATVSVVWHYLRCRRRVGAVRELLDGQSKETLAQNRRETLQRALSLELPGLGYLWREFDESLVATGDQKHLYNTLDAEHFFNARTLAPGLTGSRLLAAAPSFLVAIGVLGTFVGLTIGLASLEISTDAEVQDLREGIYRLIQGAAVAFLTSVWGVAFSLALNLIEKLFERSALRRIRLVQQQIDFLYPRIPAEQSLLHIADHTREGTSALQELHERIGDRLQEAVEGMSEAMQQALADTLNNTLGPAIQTLVSNTNQQSTEVLEKLIEQFMAGMSSAGRSQGQVMQAAAEDVNNAVAKMTKQLDELFSEMAAERERQRNQAASADVAERERLEGMQRASDERQAQADARFEEMLSRLTGQLQEQLGAASDRDTQRQSAFEASVESTSRAQRELIEGTLEAGSERIESIVAAVESQQAQSERLHEQHAALIDQLQRVSDAVGESSRHLDTSSTQLGMLATNLRQAAEQMGEKASQVAHQLENVGRQNTEVAEALGAQLRTVGEIESALRESSQRLEQAASTASEGFGNLRSEQEAWLRSVHDEFRSLGDTLKEQVGALEKQAEDWLQEYGSQVSAQVHDRMDQWNQQTRSFSDQMLAAVQALANVIDELDRR